MSVLVSLAVLLLGRRGYSIALLWFLGAVWGEPSWVFLGKRFSLPSPFLCSPLPEAFALRLVCGVTLVGKGVFSEVRFFLGAFGARANLVRSCYWRQGSCLRRRVANRIQRRPFSQVKPQGRLGG